MPSVVTQKDRLKEQEASRTREKTGHVQADKRDGKDASKDKHRHRSSHSSSKPRTWHKPPAVSTPPEQRSASNGSDNPGRRSSVPEREPDNAVTAGSSPQTTTVYPSFSKVHSKESAKSRDDITTKRNTYPTPDPTELDRKKRHDSSHETRRRVSVAAPPSPPETTLTQQAPAVHSSVQRKKSDLQRATDELKKRLLRSSSSSTTSEMKKDRAAEPAKLRKEPRTPTKDTRPLSHSSSARSPRTDTPYKNRFSHAAVVDESLSSSSMQRSKSAQSPSRKSISDDSDATSIAPAQHSAAHVFAPLAPNVSTPTVLPTRFQHAPVANGVPSNNPPQVIDKPPRVDYLLQHGGLSHEVPDRILSDTAASDNTPGAKLTTEQVFAPFHNLLDAYISVVAKGGSLAVATGYRSVARRLLDRLETVFARDISSETCVCVLCNTAPSPEQLSSSQPGTATAAPSDAITATPTADRRGISWGEILEYVSGRRDLPPWPPFLLDSSAANLSESVLLAEQAAPMQALDIDVPEEFRAHYVRQSQKTKASVDKWLESQPITTPASAPADVDDETLTFAMLTRLDTLQRSLFKTLLGVKPAETNTTGSSSLHSLQTGSTSLQRTGVAIQRLYRLRRPPREPESAVYMLQHPAMHNVLATLAAISDDEWEILVSGRFDGFLRSGADTHVAPSSSSTTTTTKLPALRSPAALGGPVTLDQDTELATLTHLEREIFNGMESLEDAFEALHTKAESVRALLRSRAGGLARASSQASPGAFMETARSTQSQSAYTAACTAGVQGGERCWINGPPRASKSSTTGTGTGTGTFSGTSTGTGIDGSELGPDDSASNFSRARHRRPKARRRERTTPVVFEEEA